MSKALAGALAGALIALSVLFWLVICIPFTAKIYSLLSGVIYG